MPGTSQILHPQGRVSILVFLPMPAAQVVINQLISHAYDAVAVSTVPDVFDALRSDRFGLAVTIRSDIDLVRNIKSIPVINLEIFFHADPSGNSKRFDNKAFLARVDALSETPPTRRRALLETGKSRPDGGTIISRWCAALKGLPKARPVASVKD